MTVTGEPVVLVVDNDPVVRKLVRGILERVGLGCIEAADGESGLEVAVETSVSAVIVELVLPGMSGAELAWRLRRKVSGLPVVAVSGRLDLWDEDDLADLGICETLPKPFEPGRLIRAVTHALRRPPLQKRQRAWPDEASWLSQPEGLFRRSRLAKVGALQGSPNTPA